MFDHVRCDYSLGDDTFRTCQTKSIEPDFGGTLDLYYIDPAGWLWEIDYSGTSDYRLASRKNNEYSIPAWFRRIPTGKHGKVKVKNITNYVIIYPTDYEGPWEDWPEARLHIVNGKVQSYALKFKGEPCFKD